MKGFIGLSFLLFLIASTTAQDCVWNKDSDFPVSYPPLLIDKVPWLSLKAVMETGQRIVRVTEGTSIVVACSGTRITSLGVEVTEGVCTQGRILIGTQSYTVLELACTSRIRDAINNFLGPCGDQGIGTISTMGFNVVGYQFYPVIQFCFEPINQISLYAQNIIYGKSVSASDGNPSSPSFKDDNLLYPTINPNDCYLTANQDAYVTTVLGDPDIIDLNTNNYFARGHMAPNADFLIEMEADASYWYPNAMPQWQLYNAGNWMYLESNCRSLANSHQVDLQITTGPWEILSFTDVNSVTMDAYICEDQQQHLIPVPKTVWKVIYDPVLDQGLAVITSNIPNQVTPLVPLCPDLDCNTIPWLQVSAAFDPNSLSKGFTYCCTVQDYHIVNPHSPDYPTAGILLN